MKNVLIILGFPLWFPLLVSAFVVVLSLYITFISILICVFASAIALLVSGIFAGIVAGVYFVLSGNLTTGLALIGCGITAVGLSIFAFLGCKLLIKLIKCITNSSINFFKKEKVYE